MKYELVDTINLKTNECLVLGLFSDKTLPESIQALDKEQNQLITRLVSKLTEKGDLIWQTDIDDHSLLLVHCGEKSKFKTQNLDQCLNDIALALSKQRIKTATLCLPLTELNEPNAQIQDMILGLENAHHQLLQFKTQKKPYSLKKISLYLPDAKIETIQSAQAIAEGIKLTRTLADLPPNVCTPTYLGEQALEIAKQYHLECSLLGPKEMQQLGMGALLAVAQGSHQEPRFIELRYRGTQAQEAPIILVGKGITFDSGGLSLKPANVMDEMKYDMAGAATVLGVLQIVAALKLPINLIGLVASAENLPGGSAVKPGDIVTSLSGQTIEILNTDAEGRLVLADALTYAERFNPQFVIDIATLTGAIIVALGHINTGFMTYDEELAQLIINAGINTGDTVWRMPLEEPYQEALSSPLADMINASFDRTASSITAACFLSRFTKKYRWAHMDIAGTAWVPGKKRHATGRPVKLLIELLQHVAHSN